MYFGKHARFWNAYYNRCKDTVMDKSGGGIAAPVRETSMTLILPSASLSAGTSERMVTIPIVGKQTGCIGGFGSEVLEL